MAEIDGFHRGGGVARRARSGHHLVKSFEPSAAWTEDSTNNYLLVDLPDFKRQEVKLQVDSTGQITVSGERLGNDDTYIYFQKSFEAPANSDVDNISGKFDGEMLYVTVPKKAAVPERNESEMEAENVRGVSEPHKHSDGVRHGKGKMSSRVDGFRSDVIRKWGNENTALDRAVDMIRENKGILITAVIAFSLGWILSSKFQSAGGPGEDHFLYPPKSH